MPPSQRPPPSTPFDVFKKSFSLPKPTSPDSWEVGQTLTLYGFLGKRRDKGLNLSFCDVHLNNLSHSTIQIVSNWEEEGSAQHTAHCELKSAPSYSAVCVKGVLKETKDITPANDKAVSEAVSHAAPKKALPKYELELRSVECLNAFPKNVIVSKNVVWPPKSRHLQMRFDPLLYDRLRFRDEITDLFRRNLRHLQFMEVETPLLFKSTPEGAREFLVPTRRKGFAYALPQSPQQYKQILMAGGVARYFQFARCFRDEDHRADRQPEFTQLDMEMAFSTGADVMQTINPLIASLLQHINTHYERTEINGVWHLSRVPGSETTSLQPNLPDMDIRCISYDEVMSKYGTDKPDLRIKSPQASPIIDASSWVTPVFQSLITRLEKPIVEACKFRFTGSPEESVKFIRDFFTRLPNTPNKLGSDSTPGVFVFESSKPMQGLSSLGHEAAANLVEHSSEDWTPCEEGDVIIIHARKNLPTQGSSTELGRLRKLIYDAAVEKGLLPKDHSYEFLWVTKFPLFSPNDEDPGQGGSAGFRSTHHPFTAPLTAEDVDLLKTEPLKAKADHYDLVLNGVEIGGGSRRIHVAEVQEYVMRIILKMTIEGLGRFTHLLGALRTGCPPHAGFAFGFDRLISVLCDVPSVKDVIAFPKNNKGEDGLVDSPSKITWAQRDTYHLRKE